MYKRRNISMKLKQPTAIGKGKMKMKVPIKGRRKHKDKLKSTRSTSYGKATASPMRRAAEVAATAVPAPVPHPGSSTIVSIVSLLPASGTTLVLTTSGSSSVALASAAITTTSTRPFVANQRTTTVWVTPSATSTPTAIAQESHADKHLNAHLPHLPIAIIVLIAVGSAALILSIFLFCKCVLFKRRRRQRPRPSAPILQESPLFGPKERFSTRLWFRASNNLTSSNSNRAGIGMGPGKGGGWKALDEGADADNAQCDVKEKADLASPDATVYPVALTSHFSPESLYPATPMINIGLALDFPLPGKSYHDTQPLKVKDKVQEDRYKKRHSITKPSYVVDMSPAPTDFQAPRPAPVPGKPKPVLKKSVSAGREKIQTPYQNYGATPSKSASVLHRLSQGDAFVYAVPSVKSDERRDRDTKALTSALGLASPIPPPSACPTSPASLYPDDSLSVVYGRAKVLSEMPSPGKMHAVLGNMMLNGFPSDSTKTLVGREGHGVSDKPPRVPSPPPLPSLAQMAMENADADYRSPTYSIYGLYEAQRKNESKLDRY